MFFAVDKQACAALCAYLANVRFCLLIRGARALQQRNEVYHNYFWNVPIHNAIYTHCYDDTGERMFVAGGPLQLGLCGGYAAIWTPR
jgi:WD repeat-containing protein 40A